MKICADTTVGVGTVIVGMHQTRIQTWTCMAVEYCQPPKVCSVEARQTPDRLVLKVTASSESIIVSQWAAPWHLICRHGAVYKLGLAAAHQAPWCSATCMRNALFVIWEVDGTKERLGKKENSAGYSVLYARRELRVTVHRPISDRVSGPAYAVGKRDRDSWHTIPWATVQQFKTVGNREPEILFSDWSSSSILIRRFQLRITLWYIRLFPPISHKSTNSD